MEYKNNIIAQKEAAIKIKMQNYFDIPTTVELNTEWVRVGTNINKSIELDFLEYTVTTSNVTVDDIQFFLEVIADELYSNDSNGITRTSNLVI